MRYQIILGIISIYVMRSEGLPYPSGFVLGTNPGYFSHLNYSIQYNREGRTTSTHIRELLPSSYQCQRANPGSQPPFYKILDSDENRWKLVQEMTDPRLGKLGIRKITYTKKFHPNGRYYIDHLDYDDQCGCFNESSMQKIYLKLIPGTYHYVDPNPNKTTRSIWLDYNDTCLLYTSPSPRDA